MASKDPAVKSVKAEMQRPNLVIENHEVQRLASKHFVTCRLIRLSFELFQLFQNENLPARGP